MRGGTAGADEAISTTYIGSLYEVESSGTTRKHIFAGANRICSEEVQPSSSPAIQQHYYHSDHLGSSNVISDATGAQVGFTEFTPYGSISKQTGSYDPKYKFTGKELDASTGLYFYGARYYDPQLGRFITADSIIQSPGDPQALNRYVYCRNNPINLIDPTGHSWKSFWKKYGGTIASIAFTFIGMPFIGALIGSAISTLANKGSFADFGISFGVGLVAGFVGGSLAGGIARGTGMNLAGIETALLRGGLAGAVGGMGSAAAYGGDIWKGAWQGAAGGMAVGGVMWGMNTLRTNDFIKNHVKLSDSYTGEQKATVMQSIKEAGQSPVGGRLMSRFIRSGSTLNLAPESASPFYNPINPPGPHVVNGTNDMYFDGNMQGRFGSLIAKEPWGTTLNDASVFVHELSHTASGYSLSDPLNVAHSENLYRGWTGSSARNDYGILSQGQASQPVRNRSAWDGLTSTW